MLARAMETSRGWHSPDFSPDNRGGTGPASICAGALWPALRSSLSYPRPRSMLPIRVRQRRCPASSSAEQPQVTPAGANTLRANLVENVRPAVVSIRVRSAITTYRPQVTEFRWMARRSSKLFRDPATAPQPGGLVEAQGSGSPRAPDGLDRDRTTTLSMGARRRGSRRCWLTARSPMRE